jgi:RNA-binding motif protein, X-linked 2
MNVVKEIQRINQIELEKGITGDASWHAEWKDSAWVYVGGLPKELTEGDVLCVFSQVGEIERLDMKRDEKTGEFRGFCFVKYEDQRSTILAVDNFTGATIGGRTIRVDHKHYNPPTKRKPKSNKKSADNEDHELQEEQRVEELKALQDVRWENSNYRKRVREDKKKSEPEAKKRKLSREEKEAKKERKRQKKLKKLQDKIKKDYL